MSDYFFEDIQGNLWWADLVAIDRMLRMWSQAKANVEALSTKENNGLKELDFDQTRHQTTRNRYYQQEIGNVSQNIYSDPQRVVSQLLERYREKPLLEQEERRKFSSVQSHNHQIIDRWVTTGERTVAALQFTRDASGAIFMACIPASGLGVGAAMLARFGGSIFQGVGSYQDSGSVGAAVATSVLSFKSSLMVLPATANRSAKLIFTVVNTGISSVSNAAVSMMTVRSGSGSRRFTDVLKSKLISGGLGTITSPLLSSIGSRLDGKVLPVLVNTIGGLGASSAAGEAIRTITSDNRTPGHRRIRTTLTSDTLISTDGSIAGTRLRAEVERLRKVESEAAWLSTPLSRYMATGDPSALLSEAQQYVMGNLLCKSN